ncbi:hypothetical protein F8S13_19380 [Chloroflexia bacterium SDU3-3]|nr:hypothetical protein F8S13_19380 [Chloroflexia bacterium SDU3-3]
MNIGEILGRMAKIQESIFGPALPKKSITYGSRIAIRASNGKYVQVNHHQAARIMALASNVQEWEIFEIVAAHDPFSYKQKTIRYGDQIALRAISNKTFVRNIVEQDPTELGALAPLVKETETFKLVAAPSMRATAARKDVDYGQPFVLQTAQGDYITCDHAADGRLRAKRSAAIGDTETFFFIHPDLPR